MVVVERVQLLHRPVVVALLAALVTGALLGLARADEAETGWRTVELFTNPDEGRYVAPLSNAAFNEPPQITTEVRPFYLYNKIPEDFLSDGGHINVLGVQARLALTDRVGLFVSKAGYAFVNFNELLPDADGAVNVAFGAKYALLSLPARGTFLTAGLRYEAPSGSIESGQVELQGAGSGFIDPFLTFSTQLGSRAGVQSSTGFNFAVDGGDDTSAFHYAIHFDYEFFDRLIGIFETNLLTTIDDGSRTPSEVLGSFEGYDLFNFGSTDSGTVITASVGARYRLSDHFQIGSGFEFPLPGRNDLVGFRVLFDVVAHL